MSGAALSVGSDLKCAGWSTGGRTYFGPTAQPAQVTMTIESTAALMRFKRLGNLALLERYRGLLHNRFVAVQSTLDVERDSEVPAEHDILKVQFVSLPDNDDARAFRVENDGRCRNTPTHAGGRDVEIDIDEHSRKHPA